MKTLITSLVLMICFLAKSQEVWFRVGAKVPSPKIKIEAIEKFNSQQINYAELTQHEQEVYYYTNVARNNPAYFWDSVINPILIAFPQLKGKNANSLKSDLQRVSQLPMFTLQSKLNATAKFHSNDMANAKGEYFSHNSTNGKSFVDRMKEAGINAYIAENISMGQQAIILSVVLLYLDIGVPDLGHRKTLLDAKYTQVGLGVSYKTNEQFYIVQDFSSEFY